MGCNGSDAAPHPQVPPPSHPASRRPQPLPWLRPCKSGQNASAAAARRAGAGGGEGRAPTPPTRQVPTEPVTGCRPPPGSFARSHGRRGGSAQGVPFLHRRGAGGPGDTFGFALRQRGILFLAIKQSRPGRAGIKGRRGFLMESCRQSQRCRDSPIALHPGSRLVAHPGGDRAPAPIPPVWDFGERVFAAPQGFPWGDGHLRLRGRSEATGIFWQREQQRKG